MGDFATILFGGDCHFGDKPVKLDGRVRELIGEAAFLVVNQESPITGIRHPSTRKEIHLRSSSYAIHSLMDLRVKVVSLANNHIADYGQAGLKETISQLRSVGITPVGAGADLCEAAHPAYVDLPDGRIIAFLAFTSRSIGSKIAGEHDYGCAEFDPAAVEQAIGRARKKANHVVLLLHYGLTNFNYPTPHERDILRSFTGRGVDLIIGHHSHAVQGYENLDDIPIFYSLGNLIFASYRKRGRVVPLSAENRRGALVAVAFCPRGARIQDIIFTEATETEDRLFLTIPRSSIDPARDFEARSRPLACASYGSFFRRYAAKRLLYRLLLWTSPRRWRTFSGAQLTGLWIVWSYINGRKIK